MPDGSTIARPVLQVEDLTVRFRRRGNEVRAVNGVSFSLARGETLTILGESGSGKSVSLKALLRLLPDYAEISGDVRLNGSEIFRCRRQLSRNCAARAISMIFQEPMSALDPVYTIGRQIAETIVQHEGISRHVAARARLGIVGTGEDPVRRAAVGKLSARNVGRHAATRDDRTGAGVFALGAAGRRAHHRAGCHRADPNPAAAAPVAAGTRAWRSCS